MNSLRTRLVLGFALVAIVPVAFLVLLMAGRIQSGVRAQAGERLTAALGVLRVQLDGERDRLGAKLQLLADGAELKRLYLVDAASDADLREHLANQQFLLGLDYLAVTDTAGTLIADGAGAANAQFGSRRDPLPIESLPRLKTPGSALVATASLRALALDGCASIRYRGEPVGLVRGGMLLDSLRLAELRQTSGVELALWDDDGHAIASTLAGPAQGSLPLDGLAGRMRIGERSYLARAETLSLGGGVSARIAGFVSTASADETLAALRWTALFLAIGAVAIAILLGIAWSLQISRPVERLAAFSEKLSHGEWDEPLELRSVREVQTLVDALERMRGDLHGYRDRLVATERQAAYGQMARKVAHEIKNPLTPIAVSVADLKRSYEQKRPDFGEILDQAVRTIDEEVQSLKRMLQEFSEFGRFPPAQFDACDLGALLADLRALHGRELAAGRLAIEPVNGTLVLSADRSQLRQALRNLVQNALDATMDRGAVRVSARASANGCELVVADTGPGLTAEQVAQLFVPGFTTKAHGSGLGLTIVERIVADHGGTIDVRATPGAGTTFTVRLPLSRGA